MFSPRLQGEKSRLVSQVYTAGSRYCLEFWYHMYGTSIGILNIYVKAVSQSLSVADKVFTKSGNQGNMWRYARTSVFTLQDDFQVA